MYNNTFPFGFNSNCGPVGCSPFNCTPYNCAPYGCTPFNGYGINNNWCGDFGSPVAGWNNIPAYGFGSNGINNYGFNGFNGSFNTGLPYGQWNQGLWGQQFGYGLNNWNWNNVPFSGWNTSNSFGVHPIHTAQFNYPLSGNIPFNGMQQGLGFHGLNSINGSSVYSTPWMNSIGCSPVNGYAPFVGYSPIQGVSNWFSSPWMGYAYNGYTQHQNVVHNGKAPINTPVNGQYIPTGAYPYNCAPFSVPFQSNGFVPGNGYVPAGQGINCEAA